MLDDDFSQPRPVPQPAASCLLLRRSVLRNDHIFDERYPIFFNDVQFARWLAERELTLWVTPEATVVHEAHASTRMLGGAGKQQYLGSTIRMLKETESPARVWLFRLVVFAQHVPMWALVRPNTIGVKQLWNALSEMSAHFRLPRRARPDGSTSIRRSTTLTRAREDAAMSRSVRRRLSRLVAPAFEPLARRQLQAISRQATTDEEIVDIAFDFSVGAVNIRPYQIRSELVQFIELVRSRSPRAILEVGTANGGTLFALAQVSAPDAVVVSIDLVGGPFGGGYPGWRRSLYQSFAGPDQDIALLFGDSHTDEMVATVRHALDGRALDVILIDADHAYAGVRRDFESYSKLSLQADS